MFTGWSVYSLGLQGDVTFNYAYGQAGLSVHMAKRPGTVREK